MTHPRAQIAIVWLAFVLRGLYYCIAQPMWEGLDEWAHFAAVEYFAEHGRMPARTDLAADQVVRSLELTPLPWSNNGWVAGAVNHDEFWQLPADQQARRRYELGSLTAAYRRPPELPPALQRQYEAQQPPLYYAIFAPLWRISGGWPLPAQVLWLRVWSLLAASTMIPLTYAIARRVPAARSSAVLVAVLVAAMPSVVIYVARVSNDALAVPLITLALWSLVCSRSRTVTAQLRTGGALGLAMLAKAYSLALVPVFAARAIHNRKLAVTILLALGIAGWWYAGNIATTGTLTGDQMAMAAHTGLLAAIPRMQWGLVADSAATTHIWISGWSFLQLRSWMYRVWEAIALIGAVGVVLLIRRRPRPILGPTNVLAAAMLLFLLATAYFAISTFVAMNLSAGVGWYMVAMSAVEATLLACGYAAWLGLPCARFALGVTIVLAMALDLYTVHFMLGPYYTGLIRHRANGSVQAFHLSDLTIGIAGYFQRLDWVSPGFSTVAWAAYLAGTAILACVTVYALRYTRRPVK